MFSAHRILKSRVLKSAIPVKGQTLRSSRLRAFRLLTPALTSFEEERENYFVGRFPGAALTLFADLGLLSFAPTGLSVSSFASAPQDELSRLVKILTLTRPSVTISHPTGRGLSSSLFFSAQQRLMT